MPSDEAVERFQRVLEFDRVHAVFDGGRIVAGSGSFAFDLTVPGGSVPCAGVSIVGVDPTHRRRGIMSQLMRAELEAAHERGEPIAALWASEAAIYGRFGFGLASLCGEIDLSRERTAFVIPVEAPAVRFVDVSEAVELFPVVYDPVAAETPGMFSRSRAWWETRVLEDHEARSDGGGPRRRVVVEESGAPVAYAVYRHHQSFDHSSSTGHIRVIEAIGATPGATAKVWRYLLDVDWIASVQAGLLPLDHPLFLLLAEARRMNFIVVDALWVRLVDVGAALSDRGYAAEGEVVFEIADGFCPWNEGRWRLAGGTAERIDAQPDLRIAVDGLGAVYLGGFTFRELFEAGRVEEVKPGALARADALFRSDRAPWSPEIF